MTVLSGALLGTCRTAVPKDLFRERIVFITIGSSIPPTICATGAEAEAGLSCREGGSLL